MKCSVRLSTKAPAIHDQKYGGRYSSTLTAIATTHFSTRSQIGCAQ